MENALQNKVRRNCLFPLHPWMFPVSQGKHESLIVSHSVPCSALKKTPSFFAFLFALWTLQQAAATSSMTKPTTSSTKDTTLVWSRVLKVKVTPVPAMPITREMTPKGNTQRYQDFSVPPVACVSLSRVERFSGILGVLVGALPSWGRLESGSSVGSWVVAGGWQDRRPDEQPISEL